MASRLGAIAVGLGMALAAGTGVAAAAPDTDSASSSPTSSDSESSKAPESNGDSSSSASDADTSAETEATDESEDTDVSEVEQPSTEDSAAPDRGYADHGADADPNEIVESDSREAELETEDEVAQDAVPEAGASPAQQISDDHPQPVTAERVTAEQPGSGTAEPTKTSPAAVTTASSTLRGVDTDSADTPAPAAPAGALAWLSSLAGWAQRELDYFVNGGTTPASDPRQILVDPSTGAVLGTLNTTSDSRDRLTYEVVNGPSRGTVRIDANGGFVYTPTADPVDGSTDAFTVAVRSQGFNLPTLLSLMNPSFNTTLVNVNVDIPDMVVPAPGDQSIWKFQVYNASTYTLRLTKNEESYVRPSGPPPGAVILPGEFHEFDFADYGLTTGAVISVAYVAVEDPAVVYNLELHLEALLTSTFVDCSATRGACITSAQWGRFGPTVTAMVDPTGTHVIVSADDKQRQADILQQICTTSSQTTCSFTATNRELVYSGREIAAAFLNQADHAFSYSKEITKAVSDKSSVEVSTKAASKIADVVSVEIAAQYSEDWTTTETVKRVFDIQVAPGHVATIYSEHPMIRYTGDFTLTMGNTTWNLEGVYFDLPDPSGTRSTIWTVTQAPATDALISV
jgi:hypothetical protein